MLEKMVISPQFPVEGVFIALMNGEKGLKEFCGFNYSECSIAHIMFHSFLVIGYIPSDQRGVAMLKRWALNDWPSPPLAWARRKYTVSSKYTKLAEGFETMYKRPAECTSELT